MRPRPSYSEADLRRAMRAARKEGFQVVELTPTPEGLNIVARVQDGDEREERGEVEAFECGTGSRSTKGDTSRFSMKEAVDAELRLKRLTGSGRQPKQRNLSVISSNESRDRD